MDLLTAEDSQFSLRKLGDEGALFHDFEIFEKVLVWVALWQSVTKSIFED